MERYKNSLPFLYPHHSRAPRWFEFQVQMVLFLKRTLDLEYSAAALFPNPQSSQKQPVSRNRKLKAARVWSNSLGPGLKTVDFWRQDDRSWPVQA